MKRNLFSKFFVGILMLAMSLNAIAAIPLAVPTKGLTEEQKILHVLNRLGFGARPGDVERVKAIGIQRYIEQQLDAASVVDTTAESKVANLETVKLSTSELFAKYPNPAGLLQAMEGQNRRAGAAPQASNNNEMTNADRRERQQKLRELYSKYNLKPAAQILPQIVSNRVLRAVYSERHLQEVMVDFWQNHFNVFAGKAAVR
jgi:uncharacterized protein (DUF1800 family)